MFSETSCLNWFCPFENAQCWFSIQKSAIHSKLLFCYYYYSMLCEESISYRVFAFQLISLASFYFFTYDFGTLIKIHIWYPKNYLLLLLQLQTNFRLFAYNYRVSCFEEGQFIHSLEKERNRDRVINASKMIRSIIMHVSLIQFALHYNLEG